MFQPRECRRRTIARCSCYIARFAFAAAKKQEYLNACCVRWLLSFFRTTRLCIAFTLLVAAESCSSPPPPTTPAAISAEKASAPKHHDGRTDGPLPDGVLAAHAARRPAAAESAGSTRPAMVEPAAVSLGEVLSVPPATVSPPAIKRHGPSDLGLVSDGSD